MQEVVIKPVCAHSGQALSWTSAHVDRNGKGPSCTAARDPACPQTAARGIGVHPSPGGVQAMKRQEGSAPGSSSCQEPPPSSPTSTVALGKPAVSWGIAIVWPVGRNVAITKPPAGFWQL